MRYWLKWAAFILAALLLILTFTNASWLAPQPKGGIKLIAHRAIPQLYDHEGLTRDGCTATRIEQPVHDYLENTPRSLDMAARMGADMVEVDIAPTKDGRIAVFHDWGLDCRTEGNGETRDKTLSELQALDVGYGYTADGGKTFPLRGKGQRISSLEEAIAALPLTPILFNFKSKNPAEADMLAAALKAAKRDVKERRDAFYGGAGPVRRISEIYPDAWAFSMEDAKSCTKQYAHYGWSGIMPAACKGGAIFVPVNYQWAFWGFPNRLMQRMTAVGGKVVVMGPYGSEIGAGLTLPEQLGKIPSNYKGHVWVEDYWTVGPALRPGRDMRTQTQIDAAEEGLKRRRERFF